jgi:hypothetical protein
VTVNVIKDYDSQTAYNIMTSIYTQMCPSLNPQHDLRDYGVLNPHTEPCIEPGKCWYAHNPTDLRRNPFNKSGSLTYLPLACNNAY